LNWIADSTPSGLRQIPWAHPGFNPGLFIFKPFGLLRSWVIPIDQINYGFNNKTQLLKVRRTLILITVGKTHGNEEQDHNNPNGVEYWSAFKWFRRKSKLPAVFIQSLSYIVLPVF
jgi:hypothetical protein